MKYKLNNNGKWTKTKLHKLTLCIKVLYVNTWQSDEAKGEGTVSLYDGCV